MEKGYPIRPSMKTKLIAAQCHHESLGAAMITTNSMAGHCLRT